MTSLATALHPKRHKRPFIHHEVVPFLSLVGYPIATDMFNTTSSAFTKPEGEYFNGANAYGEFVSFENYRQIQAMTDAK